ncbi:MAG: YsnF/AvaK domain-containing protein [Chloroflexi bacterium]|nr:YsnF/AvaK domain-containing protein [Chloroflexota bacterium]
MSENTRGRGSSRYSVREGMDVLDQNGDKIGKAGETMAGGRYFNVDAGFLGMKEYYVPLDAVTEVGDDAVYVNTTKDRLETMGWDRRPEEQSGSGTDVRGGSRTTEVRGGSQTGERMQLRQEELQARKEQVETGRVQIGKDVVEEQKTLEVPVTREEVTIDRRQVERRPSDTPIGSGTEETIRVPVREERVEVEKTPVVYEEVGVGKREVTESQQVSDTVRREEARIERHGDVNVQGWDEAMPQYRQRWQQRAGRSGGRWEDAEPAYRYGHGLRGRPEYKGRSWTEVEPQVRQGWEREYPNTPWDRARDDVRESWGE